MNMKTCPICTTKLKKQDGRMICPSCGYHASSNNAEVSTTTSSQTSSDQPKMTTQTRPVYTPPTQPQVGKTVQVSTVKASKKTTHLGLAIATFMGLTFFVIMMLAIYTLREFTDSSVSSVSSIFSDEDETYEYDTESIEVADSLPESEFFQILVARIFDKDVAEITTDDLDKITQLHFYYDDDNRKGIYVVLDDGDMRNFYASDELYADYGDLSCFKKVTQLTLEYGYPSTGDLSGMESLTSIASDMTLSELADAVPYPENITSVEVFSTIFMSSMDGVEAFPNLTSLTADCMDLEDISALSNATQLTRLTITDCDWLEDFSPLYDLTNLQALSIESSALKDIGFVKNMPELSYLSISDAEALRSIDALESCADTLHYLYLEDTWDLENKDVLEKLPNLEELQFSVSYDEALPSFAHMENLTYLSIYGADDLTPIADAKNLLSLSLESCDCEDLSFLSELDSLDSLYLSYMSGYFVSLDPIAELPSLRWLEIRDSSAYANVEKLMGIPTLDGFYLEDCSIGLRPDQVPYNENLCMLGMDEVRLYPIENPKDYGWLENYEELDCSEYTDMFANFPNLMELSLRGNELDDLSFVSEGGLSNLQMLDITDNYVTDLSPLADLDYLYEIKCAGNPIANTAGLDDILLR